MFTLLTDEQKERIVREYKTRRIIVIFYAFVLVLIMALIGLLPSFLLLNSRLKEVQEHTRILAESHQVGDEEELQMWLSDINKRLGLLSPQFDTDQPSGLVEKIIAQKDSGIRITTVSITTETKENKDTIGIVVGGIARDRQTLVAFKDHINASGHFSHAALPISNLAQDSNIAFQLAFSPIELQTNQP